jgi:hypothetical protein
MLYRELLDKDSCKVERFVFRSYDKAIDYLSNSEKYFPIDSKVLRNKRMLIHYIFADYYDDKKDKIYPVLIRIETFETTGITSVVIMSYRYE